MCVCYVLYCRIKKRKNSSRHSHFETEDRTILLPGSITHVPDLVQRKDDFSIVHMRQTMPSQELLVQPTVDDDKTDTSLYAEDSIAMQRSQNTN